MKHGPASNAHFFPDQGHYQKIKKGKTYTIRTKIKKGIEDHIAVMIHRVVGKKHILYYLVERIYPGVSNTVHFVGQGTEQGLLITYWKKTGTKWVQFDEVTSK